uniref:Activated RNA polymerase II transcriptional coactivator p15 n=1 Tax=Podarcis muralis TaxID=64176 RepID=A0A670JQU9_PODMU
MSRERTLGTMLKSKELVSSSSSASDSDSETDEKAKRKTQAVPKNPVKKQKAAKREENMFQIGKMRYVSVCDLKSEVLTDVREYWMDQEGGMTPGRKGISLNPEEWSQLKDIDEVVTKNSKDEPCRNSAVIGLSSLFTLAFLF